MTPTFSLTVPLESLVWYIESPDAGDPACRCSWCGHVIPADEVPVRMFRARPGKPTLEARFHDRCLAKVCGGTVTRAERLYAASPLRSQRVATDALIQQIQRLPYVAPLNTPLSWRDEQSGQLPAQIMAFHAGAFDRDTLRVVRAYIAYYMRAPCWQHAQPTAWRAIYDSLTTARTRADIEDVIERCVAEGIDPL